MTTTDWILDLALIALVLRQIREARLDRKALLIPLGLVGWSVSHYVQAIPTAGHDLVLIGLFVAAGIALGIAGGFATHVRSDGGAFPLIRAGWTAATLWIASMTARLGFIFWITHSGQDTLARFSAHHGITSAAAWTDGLLFLALSEVVFRLGIIAVRGYRATHQPVAAGVDGEVPAPELVSA